MQGGARCPRRRSTAEHISTDAAQPGTRKGARGTACLLPASSGKAPPQSPGRKCHPAVSRLAQSYNPEGRRGSSNDPQSWKTKNAGKRTEGSSGFLNVQRDPTELVSETDCILGEKTCNTFL